MAGTYFGAGLEFQFGNDLAGFIRLVDQQGYETEPQTKYTGTKKVGWTRSNNCQLELFPNQVYKVQLSSMFSGLSPSATTSWAAK